MIWKSTILMTLIDIVLIGIMVAAICLLWRNRNKLRKASAFRGTLLLVVGLSIIGVFYLVDLYAMFVLPALTSRVFASDFMAQLHFNYNWIMVLLSSLCVLWGGVLIIKNLFAFVDKTEKSEAKYTDLYENAPDMFISVDAQTGTILDCNNALRVNTGVSRNDVVGKPIWSLYDTSDLPIILQMLEQFRKTGEVRNLHLQLVRRGGERSNVVLNASAVRDEDGRILYSRSVMRDVTEQTQTLNALEESERRFREFAENLKDVVWETSADNAEMLYVNSAFEKIWGISRETLYADSSYWLTAVYPDDRERVECAFHAMPNVGTFDEEYRIVRADGAIRWIHDRGTQIHNQQGIPYRIVGMAEDITERKEVEKELVRSRDFYLTLFHDFPALIWRSGLDATCDYFNKSWLNFRGRTLQEEMGNGWVEGVHPEDRSRCVEEYLKAFERRKAFEMEYRLRRHDGMYRWIRDIGKPFFGLDSQFAGYIGSCYDITDHKQAEFSLKDAIRFAHATMDSLSANICVLDGDGTILSINENWKRFGLNNGLSSEECAVGYNYLKVCDRAIGSGADEARTVADGIRSVIQGIKEEFSCIYSCHSSTERQWFEVKVTRFKGQGPVRVVIAHENLTGKKLAQEALRRSEERYRKLVEVAPISIQEYDLDWNVLSINPAGRRMYELGREESVSGLSLWPMVKEGDGGATLDALQKVFDGHTVEFEHEARVKNTLRFFHQKITPIFQDDGTVQKLLGITEDITERKRTEERLRQVIYEARLLSQKVSHAQEHERKHLARELHDEFGQALTALNFDLSWVIKHVEKMGGPNDQRAISRKLQSMSGQIVAIIQSVRKIARALRPSILDDLGLVEALQSECLEFQERTGIVCRVAIAPEVQSKDIDSEVTTACYRISQEFLTNVIRHSQASLVNAWLSISSQHLVLEMKDDGRGITDTQMNNSHSLGIAGMRERARASGGTLTISGEAGKGTRVIARFPVHTMT